MPGRHLTTQMRAWDIQEARDDSGGDDADSSLLMKTARVRMTTSMGRGAQVRMRSQNVDTFYLTTEAVKTIHSLEGTSVTAMCQTSWGACRLQQAHRHAKGDTSPSWGDTQPLTWRSGLSISHLVLSKLNPLNRFMILLNQGVPEVVHQQPTIQYAELIN